MPRSFRAAPLIFSVAVACLFTMLAGCAASRGRSATDERVQRVGFRSFWVTDPARTYVTAFDDGRTYGAVKSPRPVLINTWYPAQSRGRRMMHSDYLRIDASDPAINAFSRKLSEYERDVVHNEWGAGGADKAASSRLAEIDRALARQTPAVRDASPAGGRHPVVIYHGGAGSSFEDNALLCERLATEGFVVIGSAFQMADGSSFNVDLINAGREVEFLLRVAEGMDNTDLSRVGAVGHSAGAQGLLIYAARSGTAIDAIVSLDTTQDYRTMKDPRWPLLVNALRDGRTTYATPTMFVAGPSAIFAMADTLERSQRVYLTVPRLSHNEYISQGEVAVAIMANAQPGTNGEAASRARKVEAMGERLRSLIAAYFKAKLANDRAAWGELETLRAAKLGAEPCVEIVEAGMAADPTNGTPTPRSVFLAFGRQGAAGAITELSRAQQLDPGLFDEGFAFQLLFDLAVSGRDAEVRQLFEYLLSRGVDARPFLVPQADLFASIKRYPEFVDGCVRLGRIVAGDDRATREMVEKYGSAARLKRGEGAAN